MQEDDFLNLAKLHFAEAYKSSRGDIRTARLVNSRENWERCHNQPFKKLTDENHRLLKCQTALEDKLGQTFTGMTLKQTVDNLLSLGELKHAEKLKSDFEMNDTTFAWLRVKAMARNKQWAELKKYSKQKKMPLSVANVIRIVKQQAGEEDARRLLSEADFAKPDERFSIYSELGLLVEAANAAFMAKSMESLNALEGVARDREDVLRTINNLKMKLINKQ